MKGYYREKEYRELYNMKNELHKMLKDIIMKTELGEIEDDFSDALNFSFSGGWIYSCFYYEQLRFCDSEGVEHEFDNDLASVKKLFDEIKKRYVLFKEKIHNNKKMTKKMFDAQFRIWGEEDERNL